MGPRTWWLLGAGLMLGVLVALDVHGDTPRVDSGAAAELDFLARHWRRPIPLQGEPPAHFAPAERSLAPADCGTCHPVQFADWKTSLHARSMGPGIAGQLVEMARTDPAGARSCLTCHAPLAEQAAEMRGPDGHVANPDFDAGLHGQGVVCAACHVRNHQRFGPPPRSPSPARAGSGAPPPHDGFTPTTAFLRSEFCSSCHQFTPRGFSLNGK